MKYYSYDDFAKDTNTLIKKVHHLKPDVIIGIARGGLTLAHAMAEGLNIRDVQTLRTELYDKTKKRECITVFGLCDLKNIKKALIVDDIADSGETLKAVMESLACGNKEVEFISATLFYKTTSVYKPDFWINEADEWIDFFWERDFLQ
jgi:xanthine phosphoribosyltransferase